MVSKYAGFSCRSGYHNCPGDFWKNDAPFFCSNAELCQKWVWAYHQKDADKTFKIMFTWFPAQWFYEKQWDIKFFLEKGEVWVICKPCRRYLKEDALSIFSNDPTYMSNAYKVTRKIWEATSSSWFQIEFKSLDGLVQSCMEKNSISGLIIFKNW